MPQTDDAHWNYLENVLQKKVIEMLIIAFPSGMINFELPNLIAVLAYHLL